MVLGPSLQVLETVHSAASIDEQVAALKEVKNDIVGHDQRKEIIVKHGFLETLVNILSAGSKATGKRRRSEVHTQAWTQEDEVRLQATLIIGSLANGGQAFVTPLLAAGAPEALLDTLSTNAAPKLVTATLQALKNIASSQPKQTKPESDHGESLVLFTQESIDAFLDILRQPSITPAGKQQLRLVADIITVSDPHENTKATLVHLGVLDTLAGLLAAYAVDQKHVDYHGSWENLLSCPPMTVVPSILDAVITIVAGSTYHVHRFFLSPPILELFWPVSSANGDQRHLLGPRHGFASLPSEPLLPTLHIPAYGTTTYYGGSRAFPALASLQFHDRRRGVSDSINMPRGDSDHANAVCGWLLYLARSMHGYDRLVALTLLALVNNAIDTDAVSIGHRSEHVQKTREREKQLVLLAVPLAVRLVQSASESKPADSSSLAEQRDNRLVREESCGALAALIECSKDLQVAAVDAGAIKHVCPVLKKSFDNVPLAKPMWSAKSSNSDQPDASATRRMGSRGLSPEIRHAMRCRRNALEALAGLASREDLHRRAIVEAGVVSCIIDSLKPFPPDYSEKLIANRGQVGPKDGNTLEVILGACHVAKTMSRSVSLLRTSLIDAGVAKPIFHLLSHQDPRIQLAATDVCINLLTDFSPMREDLVAEGVIKSLTEHARTSSPALRLSSLWALKHLVMAADKAIKVKALEELGAGWLVSAIQGEQRVPASTLSGGGVSVGLSTPNAAGEQVDLLNPSSMDVDEPVSEEDSEGEEDDGEVMYDESAGTHYQASQLRSTLNPAPPTFNSKKYLSSVREMEQNPALQAKRDDTAVQEQALNFIRNLISPDDGAFMVEHLMAQIGSTKFFEILTAKLAPLPASARLTGGSRQIYSPIAIILSTTHIINHVSNAAPRHKQLLIAQKSLLQAWLPHFSHVDRQVRVMCVWAVNSLTWVEDESDRREARQRAMELRSIGIESKVRDMATDPDLDVKERVKTAVRQFDLLL